MTFWFGNFSYGLEICASWFHLVGGELEFIFPHQSIQLQLFRLSATLSFLLLIPVCFIDILSSSLWLELTFLEVVVFVHPTEFLHT